MIEYRDLTHGDISNLVDAAIHFHHENATRTRPVNVDRAKHVVKALIDAPTSLVYGALEGPFVVGFIAAEVVPDLWSEGVFSAAEHAFYTLPQYRKMGVGSRIIERFLEWADEHKADVRLTIDSGVDDERAAALYEKYGLKRRGFILGKEFAPCPQD